MTDNDLALAYKNGDEGAFNQLYSKYRHTVTGWAGMFVHNEAYAEEICQDVWLIVSQYLKKINLGVQFRTILYKITQNEIRNWVRDNHHPETNYTNEELAKLKVYCNESPDFDFGINELLKPLSPEDRALILAKIEGYTDEELAGSLSISVNAVKSRLFRAREIIREAGK